jgi:hypothetical protein
LWRLASGAAPLTIVPAGSALQRTHAPEYYRRLALDLRTGEELPLETIEAHLQSIGYARREPVEMVGEYSIRGGILDVFPPNLRVRCVSNSSAMRSNPSAVSKSRRSVRSPPERSHDSAAGRAAALGRRLIPAGNSRWRWTSRASTTSRR